MKGFKIYNSAGAVQLDSNFRTMRAYKTRVTGDLDADLNYYRSAFGMTFLQNGVLNQSFGVPVSALQPFLVMISPDPSGPKFYIWDVGYYVVSGTTILGFRMALVPGQTGNINFFIRYYALDGDFISSGTKGMRLKDPATGVEILDSRRRYVRVRQNIILPAVDGILGPDFGSGGSYNQNVIFEAYEGRKTWFSIESFGVCNVGTNAAGLLVNSRRMRFDSATSGQLSAVRVRTNANPNPGVWQHAGVRNLLIAAD